MKVGPTRLIWILICGVLAAGCGQSNPELSFQDIPHYPASTPERSMDGSAAGGIMPGRLIQVSTTDPFDTVTEFYQEGLGAYHPQVVSHSSELGRQTALTIQQGQQVLSVSLQELEAEGRVVITHMAAGIPSS